MAKQTKSRDLLWASEHFKKLNPKYELYEKYYDGDQPLRVSDELRDEFKQMINELADNLCPKIVHAVPDRLILQGFSSNQKTEAEWANKLWQSQRMPTEADTVHEDQFKLGDGYVIIWPKEGTDNEPVIYVQDAKNIAVRYSYVGERLQIVEAVKAWEDTLNGKPVLRVTIYDDKQVRRFYTDAKGCRMPDSTEDLKPWESNDPGDEAEYQHNLGVVPVVHFPASRRAKVFGRSVLKNAWKLQDIVNMWLINLVVGAEFYGLPRRYIIGAQIPRDNRTGKVNGDALANIMDAVWGIPNKEAKVGQFDAADLSILVNALNDARREMARVTDTPEHVMQILEGDFPSGKALETAEAPLTTKVKKYWNFNGDRWEDVLKIAALIAGVTLTDELKAQWVDTCPHDDLEKSQVSAAKKGFGVSNDQLQIEWGYDDETRAKMAQDVAEENRVKMETARAAFDSGRVDRGGR